MSSFALIIALSVLLLIAVIVGVVLWVGKKRAARRMATLNQEMLEASRDASVGRRLTVPREANSAQLASTINRLFDALGERDEKIQGRDRLFTDFAKTLPEIVIVHDEKILLANESAASLIGLDSTQLVGREVADLVKPAYRALFRNTVAKRLAGKNAPRRLEIQSFTVIRPFLRLRAMSATARALRCRLVAVNGRRNIRWSRSLRA